MIALLAIILRLRAEAEGAPVRILPTEVRHLAVDALERGLVGFDLSAGWVLLDAGMLALAFGVDAGLMAKIAGESPKGWKP